MEILNLSFVPNQTLTAESLNKIVEKINEIINTINGTDITTDVSEIAEMVFASNGTGPGEYSVAPEHGYFGAGYLPYALRITTYKEVDGETVATGYRMITAKSKFPLYISSYTTNLSVQCNHEYRNEDHLKYFTCEEDGATNLTLDSTLTYSAGTPTPFDVFYDKNRYRDNFVKAGGQYGLTNAAKLTGTIKYTPLAEYGDPVEKTITYSTDASVSLKNDHQLIGLSGVLKGVSWDAFIANPQYYINKIKSNDKSPIIAAAVDTREQAFGEELKWLINDYTQHNINNRDTMPSYFLNESRINTFIQNEIRFYKNRGLSIGAANTLQGANTLGNIESRMKDLVVKYYSKYTDPQGRGPWTNRQPSIEDAWGSNFSGYNIWEQYYENIYNNQDQIGERFSKYYCLQNPKDYIEGGSDIFGEGPIWEKMPDSVNSTRTVNDTKDLKQGDIFIVLKRDVYIMGNARVFSCFPVIGQRSIQLPIEKDVILGLTNSSNWIDNISTDYVPEEHKLLDSRGNKININIDWEQTVEDFDGNAYHRYGGSDFQIFAFQVNDPITFRNMSWHS